jgi:hypothetical protein
LRAWRISSSATITSGAERFQRRAPAEVRRAGRDQFVAAAAHGALQALECGQALAVAGNVREVRGAQALEGGPRGSRPESEGYPCRQSSACFCAALLLDCGDALRPYLNQPPRLGQRVWVDPAANRDRRRSSSATDVSIWPGAVVRGDVNFIRIGARSNLQDQCVVHVTHAGPHGPRAACRR